MDLQEALKEYIRATENLKGLAKRQYTQDDCPLAKSNHYGLSQALWGTGQCEWECEFCGEVFSE